MKIFRLWLTGVDREYFDDGQLTMCLCSGTME